MSNQIGRFEILSEINHSQVGSVYKASDPQSTQTVALKTIKLDLLGDQAAAYVQRITEESLNAKVLNSHNLAVVNGVEEIEGQLCASLEYVQGNSVATMLARKEGFSIWDLQDIARQTCQGLDHAHTKNIFHYSLEPAKIMVTWDGTVKILGFGISTMGAYAAQAHGPAPEALQYMSPEQLRDDPLDARSNLFSLGAILYEMVTERPAFQGEEADQVRQSILDMTPVAPDQVNRKIHPVLSQVIMKALSKSPDDRYQSGQELVNDLERCKESATKSSSKAAPAVQAPKQAKAAPSVPQQPAVAPHPVIARAEAAPPAKIAAPAKQFEPADPTATPAEVASTPQRAAAAAAGIASSAGLSGASEPPRMPKLDPSQQFVSTCVKASVETLTRPTANQSAATIEPEVEAPHVAVDPMMAEPAAGAAGSRRSFSEIDELPPLKEVYVAPAPPPPSEEQTSEPRATIYQAPVEEKPRIQPREAAKKAVKEIKKTPPKLFMYAIAAAVGVILLIVVGIAFHIRNEDSDDESTPVGTAAPAQAQPAGAATASVPVASAPVESSAAPVEATPSVSVKSKYNPKAKKAATKTPAPAPVIVPGQITVNSVPSGAQIHVDGQSDPNWTTPYNVANLTPGQHSISVSKGGYSTETRSIDVSSGSKSVVAVQLAALTAAVSVGGEPAGASIFIDGKDTGRVTPAQVTADKPGNHSVTVKKQGYLEESTTVDLQAGQVFHYAPTLKALGNTDAIKMGGKFKKMFGGAGDTSGMGMVSVKTQPKGAQVSVNNRMLDKGSPVDFYLNPGNYVVDIVATGYKSIHRVITVDKNGKAVIDDTMTRE
jgi:eukaryotic-like serine/threonine-protein kinase